MDVSVGVIGGGIGGLSAALSLLAAGFDVHVYEQASALGEVGAGVQVSPNASRILHRLGLAEELARTGVKPMAWHQRRWDDGRTLLRSPLAEPLEATFGFPHYQMHRADLLTALAGALPVERVHVGHRLTALVDGDYRVEPSSAFETDPSATQRLALANALRNASFVMQHCPIEASRLLRLADWEGSSAQDAWSGLAFARWSTATAEVIAPFWHGTLANWYELDQDVRRALAHRLASVCLRADLTGTFGQPLELLTNWIAVADDESVSALTHTLYAALGDVPPEMKENLWEGWVQEYVRRRIEGLPRALPRGGPGTDRTDPSVPVATGRRHRNDGAEPASRAPSRSGVFPSHREARRGRPRQRCPTAPPAASGRDQ